MNENVDESNQEEKEKLTCPECGKGFQDMRGLTSHARHFHELNKIEIMEAIDKNKEDSETWKILGGVGAFLLAIITAGKIK